VDRGESLRVVVVELAEVVLMKAALAWMLLCSAALAQRPEPGVPPGWAVYVVHAPWCAPCQRFRTDYHTIDRFRNQLESSFAVKSVEWDKPSEQRFARRFAIASLPGFIVFRDGIHQQSFTGYNGNWRGFLERLNLDVDRAGQTPGGGTKGSARPVTPTEQALPEITDLRLQIDRLREQLKQQAASAASALKAPAATDIPRQVETPEAPPLPTLAIPAVGHSAGAGVGADWAKLGAAALTLLAPQFAIPAGAIGVAGTVFQMLRKRRQTIAQQPRQTSPTIIERPVPVPIPQPPPAAQVVTQNQYVPIDTDTTADALAWATAQLVKQYPGAEGTVAMLGSLIEQHKAAQSGGRSSGNK